VKWRIKTTRAVLKVARHYGNKLVWTTAGWQTLTLIWPH